MTEREEFEAKDSISDKTEKEVYNLTQEIDYDQPKDQLDLNNL